jgi:hypothetical protein
VRLIVVYALFIRLICFDIVKSCSFLDLSLVLLLRIEALLVNYVVYVWIFFFFCKL